MRLGVLFVSRGLPHMGSQWGIGFYTVLAFGKGDLVRGLGFEVGVVWFVGGLVGE